MFVFLVTFSSKENEHLIDEKQSVGYGDRYDRAYWFYNFVNESLANRSDAHLLHPTHGSNFKRFDLLIELIFRDVDRRVHAWSIDYHRLFINIYACTQLNATTTT
jgi:hypothetical protein